jgi:hypothetical protein
MLRAALLAAVASIAVAVPAAAAPPIHVEYPVDVTYPIPELTPICGVDVTFSMTGTFKGTLFRDRSGTVVREFDSQPNTLITFSSPTTGKSFSYRFSTVFTTEYTGGLEPGSEAVATANGLVDKFPGVPASAGRAVFDHVIVVFVDETGVPYVNYGDLSSFTGHGNDSEALDTALCAALAP